MPKKSKLTKNQRHSTPRTSKKRASIPKGDPNQDTPRQTATRQGQYSAMKPQSRWKSVLNITVLGFIVTLIGLVFTALTVPEARRYVGLEPSLTPTPIPANFKPAQPGESLILVADFERRPGGEEIDPAFYIYEQIQKQIEQDNLEVRVERLRQVVNEDTAVESARKLGASLILYGWYDKLTINPTLARISDPNSCNCTVRRESERLSVATPEKTEFSVITDLPTWSSYLVFYTLSFEYYGESYEQFDGPRALKYINAALSSLPTNSQTSLNASLGYLLRGTIYFILDQNERSIEDYQTALDITPNLSEAYSGLGSAYSALGKDPEALENYNKSLEIKDDYVVRFLRGLYYFDKSDYASALRDFDRSIEIQPSALAYNSLGDTYLAQNDAVNAIPYYDKAISLSNNIALFYNNRGDANYYLKRFDEASRDYLKAFTLDPSYKLAKTNLIDSYYAQATVVLAEHEYDLAIIYCNKSLELDPNYSNAYYVLGEAYYAKGERDKAISSYKKFIELSEDENFKKNALERLKQLGAK